MRIVVFEWSGKHERYFAFRRDTLFDHLLDDAGRRRDAEVAPGLVPVRRRKAREVGFDQRTDRIGRETADEDEREVAGVREARLIERQRFLEIPLIDGCRRLGPQSRTVTTNRGEDRLVEQDLRARHLVREQG